MNNKIFWARLRNPGTIVAVVSGIILIATSFGVKIDNTQVMNIVQTLCSVGVALGILNNPDTKGVDMPGLPNPTVTQPNQGINNMQNTNTNTPQ